jgi:hypothetical protein
MRLRNLLPAGLVLAVLAGCSGATTTATADESSVGMDSSAKASCHSGEKAGCDAAKSKECCAGKEHCDKPAAEAPKGNE